jgi:hypothetical protein
VSKIKPYAARYAGGIWFYTENRFSNLSMLDYIRDGNEIYQKSFATIRAEANLSILPKDLEVVAVRLIHACGMTDIVSDLAYSEDVVKIGRDALKNGAKILCDAQMVANGVTRKRLPAHNPVICTLNEPEVPALAQQIGNTRSAAAMELILAWVASKANAIASVGATASNTPTTGWIGVRTGNGLHLVPGLVDEQLQRAGFAPGEVVSAWVDRGWLRKDGANRTVKATLAGNRVRLYGLTRDIADQDGEEKEQGVPC